METDENSVNDFGDLSHILLDVMFSTKKTEIEEACIAYSKLKQKSSTSGKNRQTYKIPESILNNEEEPNKIVENKIIKVLYNINLRKLKNLIDITKETKK